MMISSINKMKYLLFAILLMGLVSPGSGITSALSSLCLLSKQFLGIGAMLMIVLAGATYAIGQMLGAETRARASVWATAMLTGAVIAIVIYVIAPWIIGMILSGGSQSGTTVSLSGC